MERISGRGRPADRISDESGVKLREYRPSDCEEMARLFCETVHVVNAWDYTEEQLNAWAGGSVDIQRWNRSFLEHETVVALKNGAIVGFGDMDDTGYLDRLYVHKDFQNKGIGSMICTQLEERTKAQWITTAASITARSFFEKRGYSVVKEQQVERKGIFLTNFVMRKPLLISLVHLPSSEA